MRDQQERQTTLSVEDAWWAPGDAPVRDGCHAHPLIDGRAAMLAMCRAFLTAKDYILLAGWDIRADLLMIRGDDIRAGDDDSPEQRAYIADLRAGGLDDDALTFWNTHPLRVVDVLGFAVSRGVRVGVLLWDAFHFNNHLTNDPTKECHALAAAGVD
nr:hypothetical protein [Ktedonobacterales bacterium]